MYQPAALDLAFQALADPTRRALLERLASTEPRLLACMHGSAWKGDGAVLLRELARALGT